MDKKQFHLPLWKIGYFIGHCTVGMFGIGYFTYKTFLNRKQNVYNKKTKSFKLQSPLFRNICKTIGWSAFFLISSGYVLYSFRSTQVLFTQALKVQQSYLNTIKIDPLFQDYYIYQTMEYFAISKELIQKTEKQLDKIKEKIDLENKNNQRGNKIDQERLSIDKQLIKMALMKKNIERKTKDEVI